VYNMSGYPAMVAKYGPDMSYQLAPRAKIFRRDQGKVLDMATMKDLMRYNGGYSSLCRLDEIQWWVVSCKLCLWVWVVCVCACMRAYMCVCMSVHMHVCVCAHTCPRVCAHMCVCMCMCVCVHACVYVCVCE
jgi:hypothetical protein